MKKVMISLTAAVFAIPVLTGIFHNHRKNEELSLFPEITFSNAVEFNESEEKSDRVEIVEQNEEVQVRFKIVEWFLSVF